VLHPAAVVKTDINCEPYSSHCIGLQYPIFLQDT